MAKNTSEYAAWKNQKMKLGHMKRLPAAHKFEFNFPF